MHNKPLHWIAKKIRLPVSFALEGKRTEPTVGKFEGESGNYVHECKLH